MLEMLWSTNDVCRSTPDLVIPGLKPLHTILVIGVVTLLVQLTVVVSQWYMTLPCAEVRLITMADKAHFFTCV